MTYNRMPLQSTDGAWTAASNNTYIKDNFAAGIPHIFEAKGDLAIATQADAADNLAVGEDGSHLVRDNTQDTGVKWGKGLVPIGGILIWSGSTGSIPSEWQICNGTNGTPDLRNRFVVGSGDSYTTGNTGGATSKDLRHSHSTWGNTNTESDHSHTMASSGDLTGGAHQHTAPAATSNDFDGTDLEINWPCSTCSDYCKNDPSHTHTPPSIPANGAHTHVISNLVASYSHNHAVNTPSGDGLGSSESILPPYYALAYIMRLS